MRRCIDTVEVRVGVGVGVGVDSEDREVGDRRTRADVDRGRRTPGDVEFGMARNKLEPLCKYDVF